MIDGKVAVFKGKRVIGLGLFWMLKESREREQMPKVCRGEFSQQRYELLQHPENKKVHYFFI